MKRSAAVDNAVHAAGVAVVLLLLLIPARYSNKVYAYFPFFTVLLLVAASVGLTFYIRKSIRVDSAFADAECDRHAQVPMGLQIYNDSLLICPRAIAYLYISDLIGGTDSIMKNTFTMAAKSASDFAFDLRMDHIGEYRAGVKSMEIYDLLGLFRFPLGVSKDLNVMVMPAERENLGIHLSARSLSESTEQKSTAISDGFDYSGVREYAIGDSMKRIHWKLSAHSPNYMTKITEMSMRNDMVIIIDKNGPQADAETLACLYDAVVETALAFAKAAVQDDAEFYMMYTDKEGGASSFVPRHRADVRELIRRMAVISTDRDPERIDGAGLLRKEAMLSGGSANVIVCTSLLTNELITELINVRQSGRNAYLMFILPHEYDRVAREEATRPLNALNEYDITCRVLSADAAEVPEDA